MKSATTFTREQTRRMCALRDEGVSNADIATAIGKPVSAVATKLQRLAARGKCAARPPGRPPTEVEKRGVSPRFTPQAAEVLRAVAAAAEMRIGLVVSHALIRFIYDERDKPPLGLEPGRRETIRLRDCRLTCVISPKIPTSILDAAERVEAKRARQDKREPLKLNSIIAEACLDLLEDLNYEFVGD